MLPRTNNNSSINGHISELNAIQHYLENGWDVFTPQVDRGIDLVCYKPEYMVTVQVKTLIKCSENRTPYVNFRYKNSGKWKWDELFVWDTNRYWKIPASLIDSDIQKVRINGRFSRYCFDV